VRFLLSYWHDRLTGIQLSKVTRIARGNRATSLSCDDYDRGVDDVARSGSGTQLPDCPGKRSSQIDDGDIVRSKEAS
jgi:hypothetical protein